ncbi:GIY-YIG nuclease family protein [Brucella pseudogrignonensis]|uniref:GIY-YIG nuclease family protein n=1 Tax=Brucella pseudogrignonensis TaxID=419475 RepID=UPI000B991DFC|nr:GIY-YIG nuclease family protein [Brucella pseudogrignonensis]NKX16177.1 GIY-YIG nuclease family protein [Brucella pseudogrignonensis]
MTKSNYVQNRIIQAKKDAELLERSVVGKRHIEKNTTRHGKTVYYFRIGKGRRTRLPDPDLVGAAIFNRAYDAAANGQAFKVSEPAALPSYSLEKGTVGYTYFARSGDLVKIGFSKSVPKRLKSISTACPTEIEIIKIIPGTSQTERYFHTHFGSYRQKGEWFRLEGELAMFLSRSA